MDVDGSFALSVGVAALYGAQNLPSADHLPRVLGWIDKNTKLGGRDVKNLTSSADMASAPVDNQVSGVQSVGVPGGQICRMPDARRARTQARSSPGLYGLVR